MGSFLVRSVLMLGGLACVACEVWGTYEYLHGKYLGWNYLVAGGIVLTSLAAILPMAAEHAHRQHARGLKWMAWLALPIALAFVFTVSVQRTGSAADGDESDRKQRAISISIAKTEQAEAEKQHIEDKGTVKRNCDVWGPICTKAKSAQEKTEQKLQAARDTLKTKGTPLDESMAKRIVAFVPFLTVDQVHLWQPLLLPLGLGVVGFILIAIAVRGRKSDDPKPGFWSRVRERRRQRTANTRSPIAAINPSQITVIPPTPKPKLVATNPAQPFGSVKVILTDNLQSAKGAMVEVEDLATRYREICRSNGRRVVTIEEFVSDVDKMCKSIGIKRRKFGTLLYLMDVQLIPLADRASAS